MESAMVITLTPDLETALKEQAQRQGISPEVLALATLRERLLPKTALPTPRDEWERLLLSIGSDCGVALPHSALSSDELYD